MDLSEPYKNEENPFQFPGNWKVEAYYHDYRGEGWCRMQDDVPGLELWRFTGGTKGTVKESCSGRTRTFPYRLYLNSKTLVIDRSVYACDGFCEAYSMDRYRLEPMDGGRYRLYYLECEDGRDGESFMIEISPQH